MFSLDRVICRSTTKTFGGHNWVVEVVVRMPVKEFNKHKKSNNLGQLYSVDISNFVHRFNPSIPAWNPYIDSSLRAKNGIKAIILKYYVSDSTQAESLGMKVTRLRNGEFIPGFGDVQFLG